MKLLNGLIGGTFDKSHNKKVGVGLDGIEIIRADKWLNMDAMQKDGVTSRFNENVNYLETNPQIFVVTHPSSLHKYKVGDRLFLNYMAYEWAENTEYGEIIDADFIMFKINDDDSFELIDGLYLGEEIFSAEIVTHGGIFISGGKKDNLRVKLTHIPLNSKFEIGDIVVSIDKNNYPLNYWGKTYIKLMEQEIVGVMTDKEVA